MLLINTIYVFLFLISCTSKIESTEVTKVGAANTEAWMIKDVVKRDDLYPVLKNDTTIEFFCPVLKKQIKWHETYLFNPAAIVKDGKVYLLFRGEDKVGKYGGTSRIGIAESNDGFHFTAQAAPVLYPDNDDFLAYEKDGGCEDPRVVEAEDGTYFMTYTAFNGHVARLCVASSRDLHTWKKHGLAFGNAKQGIYSNLWSKSGAIICRQQNGQLIATKIHGKYWMYWGESDIHLATSDDLINWEPVLKEIKTGKYFTSYKGNGHYNITYDSSAYIFKTALSTRMFRFDAGLVEPGPPAILTDQGIFFVYNAANSKSYGDSSLNDGEYTVSQVLFDKNDPSSVIGRSSQYFLKSENKNEVGGQLSNAAFVEGMVYFKDKWIIYYVMGEAHIGIATCNKF